MASLRSIIALPFMLVAGIAMLLLGFQAILAVLNLLNGVDLVTAAGVWVVNTIILAIVVVVVGGIGVAIKGG